MKYRHLCVLSKGPSILIRCPAIKRGGLWVVEPSWKSVVRAVHRLLERHGLMSIDLQGLSPMGSPEDETYTMLQAAYMTTDQLHGFWLYDWNADLQSFDTVRAGERLN